MAQVLIVAGEASADLHAAHLLTELQRRRPELRCFGVGGQRLAALGMDITVPAEKLNVVGMADFREKFREVLGAYRAVKREIQLRRPQMAILLDLPDFNLRLARFLKRQGIPVVYYISPQVWAWRSYRVRTIRKHVEKMLVVFPFEKTFYDAHGVNASFVGHPLLETLQVREQFRSQSEVLAAPRIAILPGSRTSEVRHHAALLQGLCERLAQAYPNAEIRLPLASTLTEAQVRVQIPHAGVKITSGDARETLVWADAAVVASGTATLETALLGTPFCLFYRLSPTTAWAVKHVFRYRKYFGMANLLLQREVVREFIQAQATSENLFQECRWMIESPEYRTRLTRDLAQCRRLLGDAGASERAAQEVLKVLDARPPVEAQLAPRFA